ncbi:uncharacterized protein [Littorina saxatilis]|uniref:uncharacterized protein isoform X2 n=1 Tax=Littorina saxatilis TaxID=31220 RepID=UPI0038B545D6
MHCRLCVGVLWLGRLVAVSYAASCPAEKPGYCNQDNNQNGNDTEVQQSFCSLDCQFETDLCNFKQGCRDDGMTAWEVVNGSAQADQTTANYCGVQSFSILESRWVNFTATLTCLQFKFKRHLPYDLDVFLVSYNNDSDVQTLLKRKLDAKTEGDFHHNMTISQMVGKVLFRLYGGGGYGGNGTRRLLRLDYVSVTEGACGTPVCSVENSPGPCGWDGMNWDSSPDANQTDFSINVTDSPASLTLPLTRPTELTLADCLTFRYKVKGAGSQLNVSVQLLDGSKTTVWSVSENGTGTNWLDGSVPVTTASAYRIIFEARKSLSADDVALSTVKVTSSDSSSSCASFPWDAWTSHNISNSSFSTCDPVPEIETTELPTTTTTLTSPPPVITSQSPTSVSNVPTTNITTTNPTTTSIIVTTAGNTTVEPTTTGVTTEDLNTTMATSENQTSMTTLVQPVTTTAEQPATSTGTTPANTSDILVHTTSEQPIASTTSTRAPETTATTDGMQKPNSSNQSAVTEGTGKDDKSSDDALIAGVVVAVIVVAVVVIVIVIWKRKSLRLSGAYRFNESTEATQPES